jgi:branched-chain amino acid transport system permease protein
MNATKKRDLILTLILCAVLLAGLVYVDKNMHYSMLASVIQKAAIYSLLAVSLNLLNGFTGLFSLGQAGFMLLGAYTYAILTIPVAQRANVYQYFNGGALKFTLPAFAGVILAGVVAACFAWLVGKPCLRLKSDYLAIATLGFAEIIRALIQWEVLGPITNASNILKRFPTYESILTPVLLSAFCIGLIVLLINSSYGRAFKAIREDEIAAEAMGINLAKTKMQAFLTSAFFAGVGGAMLAMFQASVQAKAFTSAMTYEILLIVVIGGIGSVTGSVIGSFLYIACSEWWLRFLDDSQTYLGVNIPFMRGGFRMVVFSVIIMLIVLFYRQGIMGQREFSWQAIIDFFSGKGRKSKRKAANGNG